MSSDVEICNMALRRLGLNRINSLTEANQAARDCNLFFPQHRDEVLRDYDWTFARRRKALNSYEIPEGYAGKYSHGYTLPVDCLKPRKVYEGEGTAPQKFEIFRAPTEELFLMTDVEGAELRYTMRAVDPTWFDAEFVSALSMKLASTLAVPLVKSTKLMEYWDGRYRDALGQAEVSNVQEHEPAAEVDDVPWITARTAY